MHSRCILHALSYVNGKETKMARKRGDGRQFDPAEHINSVWEFEDEEQREKMLEPITRENCGDKLKLKREVSGLSRRELAAVIGVAESTIYRL